MDWLVKSLKLCGKITIHTEKEPAMQIKADTNRINIDILRPELFKLETDGEAYEKGEEGRMDKLKDKLNATRVKEILSTYWTFQKSLHKD